MSKYKCMICGYVYDEGREDIKFDKLSSEWTCPMCGATTRLSHFKILKKFIFC